MAPELFDRAGQVHSVFRQGEGRSFIRPGEASMASQRCLQGRSILVPEVDKQLSSIGVFREDIYS